MTAALVMARAPRPGRVKTRLEPLLGPEGCARLQAALIARAARWAHEVAPGAAFVSHTPAEARDEVERLVPPATGLFAQEGEGLGERLASAVDRVLEAREDPVVVVGTDLPQLTLAHATQALTELAAGADVCFGPAADGGYYLIALGGRHPAVFDLPPGTWGGPGVLAESLSAASAAGLRTSLLREEHDLDRPEDVTRALADPSFPPDVAELLRAPTRR